LYTSYTAEVVIFNSKVEMDYNLCFIQHVFVTVNKETLKCFADGYTSLDSELGVSR